MKYRIDPTEHPVYIQIYKAIRDDVINGTYRHGVKLPSKRLLADELGVSTVTVEHAYALLCDEGYAEARERSGYFVLFRRSDGFAATPSPPRRPLPKAEEYGALPSTSLPFSVLSKTMRRVMTDRGETILKKAPNNGSSELREAIGSYLLRNRGIDIGADRIVIGSGSEYLYRLIIDLLGRDLVYAIETPSYHMIEQVYRSADLVPLLLPLSGDGIDSSALSGAKADVLHTTPYRSYPTGVTASATKRHEYLRWADEGGRYVIEDDYDSEFSVSSKPEDTLFALSKKDNVIYLNSFSKTISPSLRVSYMLLPRRLSDRFRDKLGFFSCTVPSFEQLVIAELINNGDFERHINRVRRAKRRAMLSEESFAK